MAAHREGAHGGVGDEAEAGAGHEAGKGIRRSEFPPQLGRANAPHRLGKKRDLKAALACGELEGFCSVASWKVEPTGEFSRPSSIGQRQQSEGDTQPEGAAAGHSGVRDKRL